MQTMCMQRVPATTEHATAPASTAITTAMTTAITTAMTTAIAATLSMCNKHKRSKEARKQAHPGHKSARPTLGI